MAVHREDADQKPRLKVACEYLLQNMACAEINTIYMVIRKEKWDIPAYFEGYPPSSNGHIAYLVNGGTPGVPYTVDQVYPFVHDKLTAVGFPDILFNEKQAFKKLLDHLEADRADIVLGLFPADQPEHSDLVEYDNHHVVRKIVIKPTQTDLKYTWGIAVWAPAFSDFLHQFLRDYRRNISGAAATANGGASELHLGDVIQAAVDKNFSVKALHVSDEPYIDIGRVDNYIKAIQRFLLQ
ncbi:MAG: dTDP-glucose pyrophosphorylase [Gammaproteobacteria bacterium]|nr:MAG: dTDP-glucose pyrophosphorylase [Gammaproteobacteria bacterium]TND05333.1 MAG: dTDP-glucose pyrophosphorylase [Gammaproteobacteria bacterium]